jgi:dTMP kinase
MLIVLEGLDGAGKTTQVDLLQRYFTQQNVNNIFLHFPRYNTPIYGEMIASFLRGEYGDVNEVDPHLVALLYASDRERAAQEIRAWLNEGKVVILDRYVYSNIAFQCAKVSSEHEKLREWILNLEYGFFNIPRPDVSIFIDVPFEFTIEKLKLRRNDNERKYLNKKTDIHEADLKLQKRVREIYLEQANIDSTFIIVNCADNELGIKPPETIHNEILSKLKK